MPRKDAMTPELASSIIASASRLGISPRDLATAISYETAGTFDPWKAGPTTQWGQHRGLIQWGEPQRERYGVSEGMPIPAQMQAVERYLTDAGVRPGMGLLDVYSAINAGGVGRYNASDANNGGAPGTVADKVNNQMAGHAAKADQLLALAQAQSEPQAAPAPAQPSAPMQLASAAPAPTAGLLAQPAQDEQQADPLKALQGLLGQASPQQQQPDPAPGAQRGLLARRSFPQLSMAKINLKRA
jgi:hypothetical protein